MDLKTLKDLEHQQYGSYMMYAKIEELRQEAIEHLKHINLDCPCPPEETKAIDSVRDWITWFFNITEEEIKNAKAI